MTSLDGELILTPGLSSQGRKPRSHGCFSALVAAAGLALGCSSGGGAHFGSTGNGGSVGGGGSSVGIGGQGGQSGPGSGGSSVSASGGTGAGGQTLAGTGGDIMTGGQTTLGSGGRATGGQNTAGSGGSATGGQTTPGSGGSTTGGQAGKATGGAATGGQSGVCKTDALRPGPPVSRLIPFKGVFIIRVYHDSAPRLSARRQEIVSGLSGRGVTRGRGGASARTSRPAPARAACASDHPPGSPRRCP